LLQATRSVPIVFVVVPDPVGSGFVKSMARPGGNVTGLSSQTSETAGKRVDLLRDLIPGLRRLATLVDVDNPLTDLDTGEMQRAARSVGLDVAAFEIRRAEDIASAFDALQGRAQALYIIAVPILFANRIRINVFAAAARLPTMWTQQEAVEAGGLLSYGANWQARWRRAADLVDKVLRGANPSDIPVEQPTKFDLVINLSTAKALGLKVPEPFLLRADEVIE
jgi:putative tryptophan/tyrosine transport system substrate-binding protein